MLTACAQSRCMCLDLAKGQLSRYATSNKGSTLELELTLELECRHFNQVSSIDMMPGNASRGHGLSDESNH